MSQVTTKNGELLFKPSSNYFIEDGFLYPQVKIEELSFVKDIQHIKTDALDVKHGIAKITTTNKTVFVHVEIIDDNNEGIACFNGKDANSILHVYQWFDNFELAKKVLLNSK